MSFGLMVSFGQSSGVPPKVEMNELMKRGSLFLTRPSLDHYMKEHAEYLLGCTELLTLVTEGRMKVNVKQTYYLKDAAKAHRDLEARKTTGGTIMFTEA